MPHPAYHVPSIPHLMDRLTTRNIDGPSHANPFLISAMIPQYLSKCLTSSTLLGSTPLGTQRGTKPEERTRWKDSTGRDWPPFKTASTDGKGAKTWRRVSRVCDRCPQRRSSPSTGSSGCIRKDSQEKALISPLALPWAWEELRRRRGISSCLHCHCLRRKRYAVVGLPS